MAIVIKEKRISVSDILNRFKLNGTNIVKPSSNDVETLKKEENVNDNR